MLTLAAHPTKFLRPLAIAALVAGCLSPAFAQKKPSKPSAPAKPPAAAKPSGAAGHSGTMPGRPGTTTTTGRTTTTTTGGSRTTTPPGRTTTSVGSRTPGATGMGSHPPGTSPMAHTTRPPAGSHEMHTANGSTVRTRANGQRSDIHDTRRGMDIHHGLNGERRVSVERADHSRVYAERGGRGYVQHPYMYHGHEFGHRTYYDHGRYYDRYYHRYPYRGVFVDVYAPTRYWGVGFYGWAYNPWAVPAVYAWGWGPAPWYGYYGFYFAPYPSYPSAAFWLTDYLIAQSLQDAYAEQAAANQAAMQQAAAQQVILTPEVKAMVAGEVKSELALENAEAQQNAQNQDIDPASSGIARLLSDNQPHVFVAGASLDLVDTAGTECALSQGDVIEVAAPPPPDATAANAVILASKGGNECQKSDTVAVGFSDLQDMQNHLRETIDQGLGDLQAKQGQGGLPQAPASAQAPPAQAAFAAGAPPPDTSAGAEINQQTQAADQAEQEVASAAPAPAPGAPAPPPATVTVSLGQTIDEVTANIGPPARIIDLGAKKIYVYQDMKIVFQDGKVSDVQ